MAIKQKDIKRIQKDYLFHFPGWKALKHDIIYRINEPILQGIAFDRASRDVYKPTGFINILCAPKVNDVILLELAQRLRHPNGAPDRSISLLNHEKYLEDVVAELLKQIQPPLDQALIPIDVLAIYREEAAPTKGEAYSLAHLSAYLGLFAEAKQWISRFVQLSDHRTKGGLWIPEQDDSAAHFIAQLVRWIDIGTAKDELDRVVIEAKKKLGISE